MTSNFTFLQPAFPALYNHALQAERLIFTAPRASCFYARFALEQTVLWLYENDPTLRFPYENSLGALIHESTFKNGLKLDYSLKFASFINWVIKPYISLVMLKQKTHCA
jgi:type I restriction enzyme R subunit